MTDPLTWIGSRRVLLLSPHADDIAYSIGGLVARLDGRADLSLLSVFPNSRWALSPALRAQGADAIRRIRTAEDRAFCDRYGIAYHTLAFGDSSVQGYDEAGEMAADPADDPRTGAVRDAIRDQVRALAPDLLIAPAAIGGHVDHRIVRDAARDTGVACAWYEDIPYAAWHMLRDIERGLAAEGLAVCASVDISAVLDAKIAAMWMYATQTTTGTIDEMLLHAGRLGTGGVRHAERLWA